MIFNKQILLAKIEHLLLQEAGTWGDDNRPRIEFVLVDRTTHQRMHYLPLPYDTFGKEGVTLEQALIKDNELLDIAMMNLRLAQQDFNQRFGLVKELERQIAAKAKKTKR